MKTLIKAFYSLIFLASFIVSPLELFADTRRDDSKEAAKTTETIQKAPPAGIYILLHSYGKNPRAMDELINTPCWTNPNVPGVILRAQWYQIEPTEGHYDWSFFDRGFELAQKHNKRVQMRVSAGKSSPEWVYAAGAEKFTFHHKEVKPIFDSLKRCPTDSE